jgi:acyl-coenzyme A thioesterase PaaI-like protein
MNAELPMPGAGPASVVALPFNSLLNMHPASEPDQLLELPAGSQYLNHVGTVHAGALLTLAEASSAEFLLRHCGSAQNIVPLVRRVEAKFRHPARGAGTSTASIAPEAVDRAIADLTAKGRAILFVTVELYDESGAHALSAVIEWFLQRRP